MGPFRRFRDGVPGDEVLRRIHHAARWGGSSCGFSVRVPAVTAT